MLRLLRSLLKLAPKLSFIMAVEILHASPCFIQMLFLVLQFSFQALYFNLQLNVPLVDVLLAGLILLLHALLQEVDAQLEAEVLLLQVIEVLLKVSESLGLHQREFFKCSQGMCLPKGDLLTSSPGL